MIIIRNRGKKWPRRVPFRKDLDAVEGFIGEIPALAIITFAVTAFMISAVSATGIYIEDRAKTDALEEAKDISSAIGAYSPLLIEDRADHLSASALDHLVEGRLSLELRNTGDMRVTVYDRQGGPGNRTSAWTFGNTDRTDPPTATVSRTVLIGYDALSGPHVLHLGSMEVRTW